MKPEDIPITTMTAAEQPQLHLATSAEERFCYSTSVPDIDTGCVGHLRIDFDSDGATFYSSWFDHLPDLKTEAFKQELDKVVNDLRFQSRLGYVLMNRTCMANFVSRQPGYIYGQQTCFRLDTEIHTYLLRCNPVRGDYNAYLYCYDRQRLNQVLQKQEKSRSASHGCHEPER